MKLIINLALPFLFLMSLSFSSYGAIATPRAIAKNKTKVESAFKQLSAEEIFTMSRRDVEIKIGRKLKFKEKLGLLIVQKAIKKVGKKKRAKKTGKENIMGALSLSFGGISFIATLFGFGGNLAIFSGGFLLSIAAITLGIIGLKKGESKKGLSIAGIVLGGLSFLVGLMVLLIIAAFSSI